MSRRLRYGVLAAVALVGASATAFTTVSAGGRVASAPPSNGDINIEVVTHGQASDPFWSVFKRGVDDARASIEYLQTLSIP